VSRIDLARPTADGTRFLPVSAAMVTLIPPRAMTSDKKLIYLLNNVADSASVKSHS
jgi:hypothetical protein